MASVVFFIQHILVAVERFPVELIKIHESQPQLSSCKERHDRNVETRCAVSSHKPQTCRLAIFFGFVAVRSFTADSSLLQQTECVNTTPHASHLLTFTLIDTHMRGSSCMFVVRTSRVMSHLHALMCLF